MAWRCMARRPARAATLARTRDSCASSLGGVDAPWRLRVLRCVEKGGDTGAADVGVIEGERACGRDCGDGDVRRACSDAYAL